VSQVRVLAGPLENLCTRATFWHRCIRACVTRHPSPRKFRAEDAIAAFAVHGLLVIGPLVAVADIDDCAAKLRTFTITLARDGEQQATGGGEQVLGSPLLAFAHLAEVLASQSRFPPVRAGEVITTGTLTELFPVEPGQSWSTTLEGIDLPGMSVTLA
jgi:2-keto-4-pentenoate hydratase